MREDADKNPVKEKIIIEYVDEIEQKHLDFLKSEELADKECK